MYITLHVGTFIQYQKQISWLFYVLHFKMPHKSCTSGKKWNVTPHIFEGEGRYFFAAYFAPSLQLMLCLSCLLNMLCELSLLFNKKEGVEEQFPEVTENSLYEKL